MRDEDKKARAHREIDSMSLARCREVIKSWSDELGNPELPGTELRKLVSNYRCADEVLDIERARAAKLIEALELIASCKCRVDGDVVSIAKKALADHEASK